MQINVEMLASFRVRKEGGRTYRAIEMDSEEIAQRKIYLRQFLRDFPEWSNLSNDVLDQMMIYPTDNGGYILKDDEGRDYYLHRSKVTKEEAQFRQKRAMMPFEFMELTGKAFDWSKYQADVTGCIKLVNQYIMNYLQFSENGMGLYICSGAKGSGKTMLSCCILNEVARRYFGSVKFVNALDLLEMTKKGFQGGEDEVKQLYEAALLVVDDIGVQLSKDWVDTVFYRLINDRYINRRPTIYTSNLPINRLKMDDRITDRIESTTYLLKLPEESIRRSIRQQEKKKLMDEIEKRPKPVLEP